MERGALSNIDNILAGLSKETRKRVALANTIELDRIPLASYRMTKALGGGLLRGRQFLYWGGKSSGKSSFLLQSIGEWQKQGLICAWIDAEASFDPEWATRLGVDVSELIVSPVKDTQSMVEVCTELMQLKVDVLVVDSITALVPLSWFDKKGDLKGLEGTGQIGSQSVDLARALKLLNGVNDQTCFILISQSRSNITTYGAIQQATGGQSVLFYSTAVIKLNSNSSDKEQIKGEVYIGNKLIEKNIGREVTFTIQFNKIGPPSSSATYDLYYDGADVGVDVVGEMIDVAVENDIIVKGGAWFNYDDLKLQGRANVVNYFRGNPEEYKSLKKKVLSSG